jgi:hypothetical protein
MIGYLFDPLQPQTIAQLIDKIAAAAPDWTWLALVDTAFDYEHGGFTLFPGRLNVYRTGGPLASLQAAAPCLIPLADGADAWRAQVHTLVRHCDARPMLSFLAVEKSFDPTALIEQWEPLHRVTLIDGEKYTLRFADTRTLARLPEILKPEQWRAFHRGVKEWLIFTREGALARLPAPQDGKETEENIRLDAAQLDRFMEETDATGVLRHLEIIDPQTLPADIVATPSRLYRIAEKAVAALRRAGFETWVGEGAIFVLIVLETRGKLLEAPELDSFLRARKWDPMKIRPALEKESWYAAHGGQQ